MQTSSSRSFAMFLTCTLLCLSATVQGWNFRPSSGHDVYSAAAPVLVVPSQSQYINGSATQSYWSNSYLTGTNGHQYMIVSHVVAGSFFRGSILDITTLSYKSWMVLQTKPPPPATPFQVSYDGYVIEALTPDNISILHTASQNDTSSFNLTYSADHPFLYNMGCGTFVFGTGTTTEWAMPSGRTEGTLSLNGELVTVDPNQSLSWYDRQLFTGLPTTGNWTWYELHLPGDIKTSIWAWDNAKPEQQIRAGTFQHPDGTTEIRTFEFNVVGSRSFKSNETGILYPLDWKLVFANGDVLEVSSVLGDQEIVGSPPAYEGFVNVTGHFGGRPLIAFGLVEIVRFIM